MVASLVACQPIGSSVPRTPGPDGSVVVVGGSPLVGEPAPPIELDDLAGDTVRLADLGGRPVVINFWGSWCVPCRDEFPVFVEAREQYAEDGLEILGVIYKDSAQNAQAFADDQGATWPLLQDPGERVYTAYTGFGGVPMTVFVDGEGVVRSVSYGPLSEAGFADQMALILPDA